MPAGAFIFRGFAMMFSSFLIKSVLTYSCDRRTKAINVITGTTPGILKTQLALNSKAEVPGENVLPTNAVYPLPQP